MNGIYLQFDITNILFFPTNNRKFKIGGFYSKSYNLISMNDMTAINM